jgi:hypothetical protein
MKYFMFLDDVTPMALTGRIQSARLTCVSKQARDFQPLLQNRAW